METASLLPSDWGIPAELRNRLGSTAGRQRLLLEDGHLLLVLHAVPGADETDRRGRFFWRNLAGGWQVTPEVDRGTTLRERLAEYERTIEQLERAEDGAAQARDYFDLLDRLAPLARATRNMYGVLQQARETVADDR